MCFSQFPCYFLSVNDAEFFFVAIFYTESGYTLDLIILHPLVDFSAHRCDKNRLLSF